MKVLIVELPWLGYKFAGRAGMRWAYTSEKEPVLSFRPFPFSLAYTSSLLKNAGHKVICVDCLANNVSLESFLLIVKKMLPDYLICETHTPSYTNDIKIAEKIKKESPKTKIVFAGPHATALPDEVTLKNIEYVDHVIVGEYEHLALKLVNGALESAILRNEMQPDIDSYPWPDRDGFNMKHFNETFADQYPQIQIISSRGCPFSCGYCNVFLMTSGRNIRYRNPDDVIAEMKYCIDKFHPKEFWFEDDNINGNEKKFQELMIKIKEARLGIHFKAMGHMSISRESLELFKAVGGNGFKFGVESINNDVLKRLHKGLTFEMIQTTLKNCKELGIKTHLTFCIGLPGSTEESIRRDIGFAKTQGDSYQISLAAAFPGTPLYQEAIKEKWANWKSWDDFNGMNDAMLDYPNLSSKTIYNLYKSGQEATYRKMLKQWPKYLRMIYQERGIKGIFKLFTRWDILKAVIKR